MLYIYIDYAYLFRLASFLLLVAMMGTIILTFEVRNGIKIQDMILQISH